MFTFGMYTRLYQSSDELTPEEKQMMARIMGEEKMFEEGVNPPSWVADEKIWERAKKVVKKTYGTLKGKWGVVVYVYKKMGGGEKK